MGAPFPPVPNTIRLRISGTMTGEVWANSFFFQYSGTIPTVSTLNAWASNFCSNWAGHLSPLQHPDVSLARTDITDLNSEQGAEGFATLNTPGTRAGTPIGANSAMLISYPVANRFRGGHPRSYLLVGTNTDLQDTMHWTVAFQNSCVSSLNTFLSSFIGNSTGGSTITQQVMVRYHGKYQTNNGPPHFVLATPFAVPIAANSAVGHQQIASQKGRIGRRRK